jgi:quercetin dioxygenase-like cupin family protein
MDGRSGAETFLGKPLPDSFEVRRVVVAPGCERPFDEAEWRDSIVVVASGRIELECSSGKRHPFRRGDVLWLMGLPLRALHNRWRRPAVLVAVSRLAARKAVDRGFTEPR